MNSDDAWVRDQLDPFHIRLADCESKTNPREEESGEDGLVQKQA